MTDRHADLIAKLEAAPEGSRDLDALFYCLREKLYFGRVCGPRKTGTLIKARRIFRDGKIKEQAENFVCKPYTRSVDAALTQIPNGWHVSQLRRYLYKGVEGWNWSLSYGERLASPVVHTVDENQKPKPTLMANALCIAALKARAAGEGEG